MAASVRETIAYVFTDIWFLDSHRPYLFFTNGFKKRDSRKKHSNRYLNMGELKHKVGLGQGSQTNDNIWIWITLQMIIALYFKLLSIALSGLVLILFFYLSRYILPFLLSSSLFLRDAHYEFLTSNIELYESINSQVKWWWGLLL